MKQYTMLLKKILDEGEAREDRTGVGTLAIFGHQMRFDLQIGFPILTTKKIPLRLIAVELEWFLKGRTDVKWLQDRNVHIWDEWADEAHCAPLGLTTGDLGKTYGKQWRSFGQKGSKPQVDQIKTVVEGIKKNPFGRRHIVTAWNPQDLDEIVLPPCHVLFQFYVSSEGKLSCQIYQRSADVFLGLPFNIASYALLTHVIASECDLKVGELVHVTGDTHLYKNHVNAALEQISRTHFLRPALCMTEGTTTSNFCWERLRLAHYHYHPHIPAPVAV